MEISKNQRVCEFECLIVSISMTEILSFVIK
jgi:hypothetical protein